MTRKQLRIFFLLLFSCSIIGSILFAYPNAASFFPKKIKPVWWEIKIILSTDGEYKLEQREISYSGDFYFKILWTGSMERDNSDYIIYTKECEFLEWKVQEKKVSSESEETISTKDFKQKPSFSINYILRKGANLYFDFTIQELSIPQNGSIPKVYLQMPSTGDSEIQTKNDYNYHLAGGSNLIYIQEKNIYKKTADKGFAWTWKQKKWLVGQKIPTRLTNQHKVKVKISIKPHF
ncbi:MAG: hypothetical protein ACETWK_07525 [Candidatus Aminicenantaceae bacterium]